jgi:hypothetical protein
MFQLEPGDEVKIDAWLHAEVYPEILERQKQNPEMAAMIFTDSDGREIPYMGAIGGGLTYSFTPTSLGTVVKVSFGDKVLDLTDYDMW